MKNCNGTLPKHLHSNSSGFGSKLFDTARVGIYLLLLIIVYLLVFQPLSHVNALQPTATAEVGLLANEPSSKASSMDYYAADTFVSKADQPDEISVDRMRAVAQVSGNTAGQVDEIYKKWFGAWEPVGVTNEILLEYLVEIVLAILLIWAVLLLWSFSLRKQVSARTRSLEMEIQERKQVEEALRISEMELKEAQAIAHIGSWKWDLKKGDITWSDEMFRIFGIEKNTYTGRLGDVIAKVIHPDDLHVVLPSNAANLAAGPIEYRIILPDSSIRNIWAKPGATVFDHDGKPTLLTGVAQDITVRKQEEDEIRSLSRFPAENPNPIMRFSQSGRILYANQASESLLIDWKRTIGQDLPADWYGRIAMVIESGQNQEVEVNCAGRIFSCILAPIRGEDYLNLYGQDITERKQAEQSVLESEQRFHHTLNNMVEGVLLLGYDWTYQYINQAAEIQGGRPAAELMGRTVMECWPGIEATNFFKLEQKVMQDRIPLEVEDQYTLLDGRQRWFSWHIQPAEEGLLIVTLDISERKQIEADIRQLNAELEERVEERTRALKNTQEQLLRQERLATLGQLAGSVGHELRNPLGVISNAVYFLKMSQPDASDKVRQYLDIIEKETRISTKIVSDLLEFTRIKSVFREPISIPDLVNSVLMRYPAPASEPGKNQDQSISVIVDLPDNLPKAFADSRQMEQVLGNLVVNAFQAMQLGGKLSISAAIKNDMILIEVQDTGTGILPENMSKLFEPLFTTKTAGIGLGLAVSKKLAEANGGRIEVSSEMNKGSLFRLVLPMHTSGAAAAASAPEILGAG